jgi:hypothetical protein
MSVSDAKKILLAGGELLALQISLAIYDICTNGGKRPIEFAGHTIRNINRLVDILEEIGSPSTLWIFHRIYSVFVNEHGYRIGGEYKTRNNFNLLWSKTCRILRQLDNPRRWWERLLNRRPWAS